MRTTEKPELDVCKHIKINLYRLEGDWGGEYTKEIKIYCKNCKKEYTFSLNVA
jgi:hypothetical protein